MYNSFFGLNKKPFTLLPDPDFLYLSAKHKKALAMLRYGFISDACITLITGEIGSGKTTLVRSLLSNIKEDYKVGVITNTHSSFGDLLTWILAAFEVESDAKNKAERYQAFVDYITEQYQQNNRVVLIVDEAQNMEIQTLEELRLFSNINVNQQVMLQLVLVGQPDLVDKLNQPELKQFIQRISSEYHLNPLNFDETESYIHHRLIIAGAKAAIFSKSACAAVYYYTEGVPRVINNICDLALVFAFAEEQREIGWRLIVDVVNEKITGSIERFKGRYIPSPELMHNASEVEKLRQAILEQTDVDILITK